MSANPLCGKAAEPTESDNICAALARGAGLAAGATLFTGLLAGGPALAQTPSQIIDAMTTVPGQSEQQRRIGRAIGTLCPQIAPSTGPADTQDLQVECTRMVVTSLNGRGDPSGLGISDAALNEAFLQVAHEESPAYTQVDTVNGRLEALRGVSGGIPGGINPGGLTVMLNGEAVPLAARTAFAEPAAAGDMDFGRLSAFISGNFAFGDRDETSNVSGFDYDTYGITGGADYAITDTVYAGLALGYETHNDEFDDNGGELDKDTFSVTLYGTAAPTEQAYIDAAATFSWLDFDLDRNIRYANINRTATGETDAFEYALSLGGGYDFLFDAVTVGPYVQVNYIDTDIDGFTEEGAQGLNLTYEDRSVDALNTIVGGRVSRAFSTDFGVLSLEARAEWQHEFQDDAQSITARYAADPNQVPIVILSDDPDRNFFNLGVGAVATLPQGISAFADFQALVGHEVLNDYSFTLGGRFEF